MTLLGLMADPVCTCSRGARLWEWALGVGGAWARLWVVVCGSARGVIFASHQPPSPIVFFFFRAEEKRTGRFFSFGLPDFFVLLMCGKTAGGAPCRLRSEAWLAGSPVHSRCPALAMYMQQRWEVEAGLDTAWWSRMAGSAAVGGSKWAPASGYGPCAVQVRVVTGLTAPPRAGCTWLGETLLGCG